MPVALTPGELFDFKLDDGKDRTTWHLRVLTREQEMAAGRYDTLTERIEAALQSGVAGWDDWEYQDGSPVGPQPVEGKGITLNQIYLMHPEHRMQIYNALQRRSRMEVAEAEK